MDNLVSFIIKLISDGSLDSFILSTARENIITGIVIIFILRRLAKNTDWAPNNQIFEMIIGLLSKKETRKIITCSKNTTC